MSLDTSFYSQVLYKKRKDGKWQCWNVFVRNNAATSEIVSSSWQDDSKDTSIIEDINVVSEGKNIGKANETSILEQAHGEALSMFKDKIKKGYRESKEEERTIQPMLAKVYGDEIDKYLKKRKGNVSFIVQPKLDGCRSLAHIKRDEDDGTITVSFSSRQTTPYDEQCKDLIEEITSLYTNHIEMPYDEFYLDGELYMFGEDENIQKIAGALNTKVYTPGLHDHIRLIAYDVFVPSDLTLGYEDRMELVIPLLERTERVIHIDKIYRSLSIDYGNNTHAFFKTNVKEYHDDCVKAGYEGAMLRSVDEPYMPFHRSLSLMKVKEFDTNEFLIVDVTTPKTGREAGTAIIQCQVSDSNTKLFDASCLGTREYRQQLYEDRESLIGKMATIQHQAYTMDGVPRFPKVVVVRDYE
jgi:DNA ligase 1